MPDGMWSVPSPGSKLEASGEAVGMAWSRRHVLGVATLCFVERLGCSFSDVGSRWLYKTLRFLFPALLFRLFRLFRTGSFIHNPDNPSPRYSRLSLQY